MITTSCPRNTNDENEDIAKGVGLDIESTAALERPRNRMT
jgi:hypothetical protein